MGKREQDEEISRLYRIIENELQKPEEEMDASLIAECSEWIEELRAEQGETPSIDYDRTWDSIYAKLKGRDAAQSEKAAQPAEKLHLPRRARILIRVAAALIAMLVLMMSITVVAMRNGYSCAWTYIVDNIKDIMDMSEGDGIGRGSIHIVVNDSSTEYMSIEELLEKEKLDIMFPSYLPEGIILQSVVQHDSDENAKIWTFQTSDGQLGITVHNPYRTPLDEYTDYPQYQTERLCFTITQIDDHTYNAIAQQNGYEYVIHYHDYDELINILSGMKGIDK